MNRRARQFIASASPAEILRWQVLLQSPAMQQVIQISRAKAEWEKTPEDKLHAMQIQAIRHFNNLRGAKA